MQDNLNFHVRGHEFPVLYEGESIYSSNIIRGVEYFNPLFGAERELVNPDKPLVGLDKKSLIFNVPGEYYLKVNLTNAIKVIVLSRQDSISSAVVRIFDFAVANLLYINAPDEQKRFYSDKNNYISDWFTSDRP
jgi:hypothetical protein